MILIPIGHERDTVRRWPVVSLLLIATCLLVQIALAGAEEAGAKATQSAAEEVLEYWVKRPYLELDPKLAALFGIDVDSAVAEIEAKRGPALRPPARAVEDEQYALDGLTANLWAARAERPIVRFGLVPAEAEAIDYLTSIFLHGGWLHLLGNLMFLWLAGPPLEDTWGRPAFLVLYLLAGLLGGVMWATRYDDSLIPLVGASGAIAGLMGAFAVRFFRAQITCWYLMFFFVFFKTGTLRLPAWSLLSVWALREVASAFATDAHAGQAGGVANWVHVWGFAAGMLVAWLIQVTQAERRWFQPALERSLGASENRLLADTHALLADGRNEEAWKLLGETLSRNSADPDAILARWDLAKTPSRAREMTPFLLQLIRQELRAGERDLALGHWHELVGRVGTPTLDLDLRLRLVEALAEAGQDEAAQALLAPALAGANPQGFAPPLVRLARIAHAVRAPGAEALVAALASRSDLSPADRQQLQPLLPEGPEPATPAPPPRRLEIYQGRVTALQDQHLAVEIVGQGSRTLPLARVAAIATARIAATQEILFDLLLDPPGAGGRLRTLRLRGSELTTATEPQAVTASLAALARELEQRRHRALAAALGADPGSPAAGPAGTTAPAELHPAPPPAAAEPFPVFASLADYDRHLADTSRASTPLPA
jgi:membrane associated rhomboid family serine protease